MGLDWWSIHIVSLDRLTDVEQAMVDHVQAHGRTHKNVDREEAMAMEKQERRRAQ